MAPSARPQSALEEAERADAWSAGAGAALRGAALDPARPRAARARALQAALALAARGGREAVEAAEAAEALVAELLEGRGAPWQLEAEALQAARALALAAPTGARRARLAALALTRADAEPAPVASLARDVAEELWVEDESASSGACFLALGQPAAARCLRSLPRGSRAAQGLLRRAGALAALSAGDAAALGALGAALAAEPEDGGSSLAAAALAAVGRDEHWAALPPLLLGFLSAERGAPVPGADWARLFERLCDAASAGEGFFDAPAFSRWFQQLEPATSDRCSAAAERVCARAGAALQALAVMVASEQRAVGLSAKRRLEMRLEAVVAVAGWLGVDDTAAPPPSPEQLALPWLRHEAAGRAGRAAAGLLDALAGSGSESGAARASPGLAQALLVRCASEACAGEPALLWRELRRRLGEGRWRESEWQRCAALVALVRGSKGGRELVGGEAAVGEVLPLVLPLLDEFAPAVSSVGARALRGLLDGPLTATEVRWHAPLLLSRLRTLCNASREPPVLAEALAALAAALGKAEPAAAPMSQHLAALEATLEAAQLATVPQVQALQLRFCAAVVARAGLLAVPLLPGLLAACRAGAGVGGRTNGDVREAALAALLAAVEACRPRVRAHQRAVLAVVARNRVLAQGGALAPLADTVERELCAAVMAVLQAEASLELLEADLQRLRPLVRLSIDEA
jgi:hypothetical protein